MKIFNKLVSLLLVALMLSLSVFGVSAAELIGETLDMIITGGEEEQEELVPMVAPSCNNYDYLNAGKTMLNVADEKGWILVYYTDDYGYKHARIYEKGKQIGRYDITSSTNQDPHFHLNTTPGMHYWVAFDS